MFDVREVLRGGPYGYLILFGVLMAAGLGLPLPEDIPLVTSGFFIHTGDFSFHWALLVSMVGVLGGDSVIFFFGYRFGHGRRGRSSLMERLVSDKNRGRVQRYFERYGNRTIAIARFLPGLRAPTYFTAGASGVSYWRFLLIDGLAAALSVPVWLVLGWYFGPEIDVVVKKVQGIDRVLGIVIGAVVVVVLARYLWKRLRTRGQRQSPPAPEAARSPEESGPGT